MLCHVSGSGRQQCYQMCSMSQCVVSCVRVWQAAVLSNVFYEPVCCVMCHVSGSGRQQCYQMCSMSECVVSCVRFWQAAVLSNVFSEPVCCVMWQGLAGSSAIVVATLKCLMEFFQLDPDVSIRLL